MSWNLDDDMPRLRRAVDSAPSVFNQRPWALRLAAADRVELYAAPAEELGRRLPREVVISCGAALYNLRLAIKVAGRTPACWLLPGLDPASGLLSTVPGGRTLVASVEVMPGRAARPTAAEQELYEALWLRRTDRAPFRSRPVPAPILVEMEAAAAREQAWLRTLTPGECRRLVRASRRATAEIGTSLSGLRRVPADAFGPGPADQEAPPTRADFWQPGQVERFERRPQLMALSTDDDRPLDWLRAGEALERALLTGTRYSMSVPGGRSAAYRTQLQYGPLDPHRLRPQPDVPAGYAVEASFLTQALELADLRGRPRTWPWRSNYTEVPQMVLRVGYAPVASQAERYRSAWSSLAARSADGDGGGGEVG